MRHIFHCPNREIRHAPNLASRFHVDDPQKIRVAALVNQEIRDTFASGSGPAGSGDDFAGQRWGKLEDHA